MKSRLINIFVLYLALISAQSSSDGMIHLKTKSRKICFEVSNSVSSKINLSLILQVNYPQSIAEAGQITFNEEDLTTGFHVIKYEYLITNMTHDLRVWLDDRQKTFVKTSVPRWYFVSYFNQVTLVHHGEISILPCFNDSEYIQTKFPKRTTDSSFEKSFFIDDDLNDSDLFGLPQVQTNQENGENEVTEKNLGNQQYIYHDNVFSTHKKSTTPLDALATNISPSPQKTSLTPPPPPPPTYPTTTTPTTTTTSSEINSNSSTLISILISTTTTINPILNKEISNTNIKKPTILPNINEELINSSIPELNLEENTNQIFSSYNFSELENSRSELSRSCYNSGECSGHVEHNYALVYGLIGVLSGMVVIAVVISIIFHRKKKKLVINSRTKPNNRLRQKIFEEEKEAETLLMLKEVEHIYEQIP